MIRSWQVRAVNDAVTSENRIHSDDIARKYGFTGALVSGVSVFGYLVHPLIEAYGEDWLGHSQVQVKFLKPAYVDDRLDITSITESRPDAKRCHTTQIHNQSGVLLAEMRSWRPGQLPPQSPLTQRPPAVVNPPREEISWDRILLDQAAEAWHFSYASDLHKEKLQLLQENLPLFHSGDNPPLHPYVLLKECNHALMRMFILPAWIHTGSAMIFRRVLRVGEDIEVRTIPIEKWERKGHQFIKLYVAMLSGNEVALEVEHTAIFKI